MSVLTKRNSKFTGNYKDEITQDYNDTNLPKDGKTTAR